MITAATANEDSDESNDGTSKDRGNSDVNDALQHFPAQRRSLLNSARFARGFADDAGRVIGNLLPTASLQSVTSRKYVLPDKTVASQVLMYRQLLHTKCRPGLKLSRPYEATPAQKAVMHMPWWEEGIEESKKMIISYDNLIKRLWLKGAIDPYANETPTASNDSENDNNEEDLLCIGNETITKRQDDKGDTTKLSEALITGEDLPPIPHKYWIDRMGFQQQDPITDFRSGGVLSLGMMVYIVESKPAILQRFLTGDTAVLPFGITCINVTDMIAKFLMLAKSTDRMDALLSPKPFWKMFADPNAITAVQELALSMLCDVSVELGKEKQIPYIANKTNTINGTMPGGANDKVTVFDFSTILERTEKRVRDDLLGAGPKTVDELRSIAGRLSLKYRAQLDQRIERAKQNTDSASVMTTKVIDDIIVGDNMFLNGGEDGANPRNSVVSPSQFQGAVSVFFAKVKSSKFRLSFGSANNKTNEGIESGAPVSATTVDLPPLPIEPEADEKGNPNSATVLSSNHEPTASSNEIEGDWLGTDLAAATDTICTFNISEDKDEDVDLSL